MPTVFCPLPTAHPQSTAPCLLPTAYHLLPAAPCLLSTVHFPRSTAHCLMTMTTVCFPLPAVYCPLHTGHCPLLFFYCRCLLPLSAAHSYFHCPLSTIFQLHSRNLCSLSANQKYFFTSGRLVKKLIEPKMQWIYSMHRTIGSWQWAVGREQWVVDSGKWALAVNSEQ